MGLMCYMMWCDAGWCRAWMCRVGVFVYTYILGKYSSIIQNSDVEVKEGGEEEIPAGCVLWKRSSCVRSNKQRRHLTSPLHHSVITSTIMIVSRRASSLLPSIIPSGFRRVQPFSSLSRAILPLRAIRMCPSMHDPPFSCFPSPHPLFNPLTHKPHHLSVLFIYIYLARSQHKLFFVCLGALSLAFYSTQREKESQCEADQRPKQLGGQGNQFKFKHAATMFPHPEKEYKGKVPLFLLYLLFYISIYKASIWSTHSNLKHLPSSSLISSI